MGKVSLLDVVTSKNEKTDDAAAAGQQILEQVKPRMFTHIKRMIYSLLLSL